MGAADFLVKPFEEQELELAIENVVEKQKLKEEVKTLKRQLDSYVDAGDILSTNPKVLKIKEIAKHVADTDVPVLITGESGVGKEVLARYIHTHSSRHDKPFVKVNCAALPNELLESELFGYERGAFTGALNDKPGKFELADKGTLLLDEIGEMTPHLQAKLLHVLQDSEYTRLGGKRTIRVDARVLASTNINLEENVANGKFREDLYFRLNVIRIDIPPLRERREDIPVLCNYFLCRYRDRYKSTVEEISPALMDSFLRYDWPGNVRQLENAVKRYLILPDMNVNLSEMKERSQSTSAPVAHQAERRQHVAQRCRNARRRNCRERAGAACPRRDELEPQTGGAPAEHLLQGAVEQTEALADRQPSQHAKFVQQTAGKRNFSRAVLIADNRGRYKEGPHQGVRLRSFFVSRWLSAALFSEYHIPK